MAQISDPDRIIGVRKPHPVPTAGEDRYFVSAKGPPAAYARVGVDRSGLFAELLRSLPNPRLSRMTGSLQDGREQGE